MSRVALQLGDCLAVLSTMRAASVAAIVTDPPYGLGFMGKGWDHGVPGVAYWREALRVLKPGGHLLAFGGTRTFHRLACAIEDAGAEIRDTVCWLYGSGFPKSLDVSKAIDKAAGAEREVVGKRNLHSRGKHEMGEGWRRPWMDDQSAVERSMMETAPATDAARQWAGWGTALKPAWEPVLVARKPLIGTVVANVLAHGVGALDIDGCRIEAAPGDGPMTFDRAPREVSRENWRTGGGVRAGQSSAGRWPANVAHDGSPEVVEAFAASGERGGQMGGQSRGQSRERQSGFAMTEGTTVATDTGTAARFFYCAKASRGERDAGLPAGERNTHPTVKPLGFMRWLCRLTVPPGGIVLDPFAGSGSTLIAAALEGCRGVGIDLDPGYLAIAAARLRHWTGGAEPLPALASTIADRVAS